MSSLHKAEKNMIRENERNQNKGFTMAEVLIVVAIIAVLAGVSFVSVYNYLRSMKKLEFDGYAREIFIASQNHVAMAATEGYLGYTYFGEEDSNEGVYYLVSERGSGFEKQNSVLNLMLPFGSVDETIRAGGSYIIRYHKDSAQIMDVFYWSSTDSRYPHSDPGGACYSDLLEKRENKDALQTYHYPGTTEAVDPVIGYFGGEIGLSTLKKGNPLEAPVLKVYNDEKLYVTVENINSGNDNDNEKAKLKLLITGVDSKKSKVYELDADSYRKYYNIQYDDTTKIYTVILDDITTEKWHFHELLGKEGFTPGEDITVQAVAYNNDELTNVASSTRKRTNTLFDSVMNLIDKDTGITSKMATISKIRHLENLDLKISNPTEDTPAVIKARQTKNLDWEDFKTKVTELGSNSPVNIYYGTDSVNHTQGYKPLDINYALNYNGQRHDIRNIYVNIQGNGGLIGTQSVSGEIYDLKLIDFVIKVNADSSGQRSSAGALAGNYQGSVRNVIAVNENRTKNDNITCTNTSTGDAGGLIGVLSDGSVTSSAAALYVESSNGNAGGLIGSVILGDVAWSYSGGHTIGGGKYPDDKYDVIAKNTAGGLIGVFSGDSINACYSTCSVKGNTAGGFVGISSGSISNSYSTGRVSGTTAGAFASSSSGTISGCHYFRTVNMLKESDGKLKFDGEGNAQYMSPLNSGPPTGIKAFDENITDYKGFTPSSYGKAEAYDSTLKAAYQGKYPYKGIKDLDTAFLTGGNNRSAFVNTHYGDWPLPMTFFINKPSS